MFKTFHPSGRGALGIIRPLLLVLVIAGLIAVGFGAKRLFGIDTAAASGPVLTIVQTAGTTLETDIVLPADTRDALTDTAQANGTLHWIKADGDNRADTVEIDLTPRSDRGDELKPLAARAAKISENLSALVAEFNAFDTSTSGRSLLAGLQAVTPGTGPVVVLSSGLDTNDPLNFGALAFDVEPAEIIEQLTATGELPHLEGRHITLTWIGTAGEQPPMRQPQKEYRTQLFTAIIEAAGGTVTSVIDAPAAAAGTGGHAPLVPIPPAPETYVPTVEVAPTPTSSPGTDVPAPGVPAPTIQMCVLPTGVFFEPNEALFLDRAAATNAVSQCLGEAAAPGLLADVVGHTACTARPADNPRAMQLSHERAEAVAALLTDLGVTSANIATTGVGATTPLRQPCSDPYNRAVEVTITIPA